MNSSTSQQLRATYAVLIAVGKVIPPHGIPLSDLLRALEAHLDAGTLVGLVRELERRAIVSREEGPPIIIGRGPEYEDGLERIRLASAELRK